jgi:DNA helicase-2/ATP-dependent DNA helicase PcrA
MPHSYALGSPSRKYGTVDYQSALNPEQYAAVTSPPGPALVIAGAGSGKTRTLTYRVAWLMDQGTPPSRILLLTFTNKAAREMLERVSHIVPRDLTPLWGGTFHHIGHKILRLHSLDAGLSPSFTILDRDDALDVLHSVYSDIGINTKDKRFPKPSVIHEAISYAENTQKNLQDICENNFPHLAEFLESLTKLHKAYTQKKRALNAVDYDDLLTLPLSLLKQKPTLAERYQYQFQAILVDEFQDTNKIQSSLIDLLAAVHRHLMVVGDDAQSIYSWRGANFENIITFPERYPDVRIFRIETNYRSRPEILTLANTSIATNTRQFPKALRAVKPSGPLPVLVPCADPRQQADFICQRVLELQQEGIDLREMAVLYRAHSHALELQMELTRRNIPFIITSGLQFFQQAHVKDLAAHLRIALNPADEIAFQRVVALVPGIGPATAKKLFATLSHGADWTKAAVPAKSAPAWKQLSHLIMQLRQKPGATENSTTSQPSAHLPAHIMIDFTLDGFYADALKLRYDNAPQRLEDLRQLRDFSRQFDTPAEFLSQLTLLTGVDMARPENAEPDADTLRLSTIHQAKGLEWKVVFLIHLAEGLLPLARASLNEADLEEERRLFYVAVTRAQEHLYLTYPIIRFTRGAYGFDPILRKSRFLSEIPHELLDEWQLQPPRPDWSGTTASSVRSQYAQPDTDHNQSPADDDEPF